MPKCPVGVHNPQRIVRCVHDLPTGEQVCHDGGAEIGEQRAEGGGENASREAGALLAAAILHLKHLHLLDQPTGEERAQQTVVQVPERRGDGQPVEEAQVTRTDQDHL